MAVVLVATPGDALANSYCTVPEADTYHASHLYPDVWNDADPEQKVNGLITATRLLDENIQWFGFQRTVGQRLAWPRVGATYRSGYAIPTTVIPEPIRNATAEFARLLIGAGAMPNSGSEIPVGLKQIKVGSVDLQYDPAMTSGQEDAVPPSVWSMISFLVEYRTQGRTNFPLVRM